MDAAEIVRRRKASHGNPPCPIEGCSYTARGRMGLCEKHAALVPVKASLDLMGECLQAQVEIKKRHWVKWQAWVQEQVKA